MTLTLKFGEPTLVNSQISISAVATFGNFTHSFGASDYRYKGEKRSVVVNRLHSMITESATKWAKGLKSAL